MPPLSPPVASYLEDIVGRTAELALPLESVVLFGSAATGGFEGTTSDVDLLLVVPDGTPPHARHRLRAEVERLEVLHGFRRGGVEEGPIEAFARRVTANVRSFFLCSRADLLSGHPARILGISRFQALFVDRAVVPSIVYSAVTVHGEDLLPRVPMEPVRRFDVLKAFFGLSNQVLLSAAMYPFVPAATAYAAGALKRSVHNCYFCIHGRTAPLAEEVAFFQQQGGPTRALDRMMRLRREHRRSLGFVLACLPALIRLHTGTATRHRFPRAPWRRG